MPAYRSLYIRQSEADRVLQAKRAGPRKRRHDWRAVTYPRGRPPHKSFHVGRQLLTEFCAERGTSYKALYARVARWPAGQYGEWFWAQVAAVDELAALTPSSLRARILHLANFYSRKARGIP